MAFNSANFQSYALRGSGYPQIWVYNAGSDSFATCIASGYFNSLSNVVLTGDKLLVQTTTSGLSFSGTFRLSDTSVLVDWDNTLRFETQMADVSAPSTVWFSVPPVGVITQVYGVQWSAVTAANSAVAFSIGASAITGATLTVTTSGAAGTAYSATPTANNVTDGTTAVKAVSDGASSTTAIMTLGFKIICPAQI